MRANPSRHGAILIIVLIILSGLSLLTFGISYRCRVEIRMARYQVDRASARQLAQAGLVVAIDRLRQDTNRIDHAGELWYGDLAGDIEKWLPEQLGQHASSQAVHVQVRDEESKLNISRATEEELSRLPGLSRPMIASLLDWIDADDELRPDGAETAYYLSRPMPYRAKNKPLESLSELLLIRGIDLRLYEGSSPATFDPGMSRETQQIRPAPAASIPGQHRPGFRDLLTVHGTGRLNLNTAPLAVLLTISGVSEKTIQAIVRSRNGADGILGTHDDAPLDDLAQLRARSEITDFEMDMLRRRCQLNSTHFTIVCRGEIDYGRCCYQIEAVVRRTDDGVVTIVYREMVGN